MYKRRPADVRIVWWPRLGVIKQVWKNISAWESGKIQARILGIGVHRDVRAKVDGSATQ